MSAFIDLTHQRFTRLTPIYISRRQGKSIYWYCRCACGNFKEVNGARLRSHHTKSCGCLRKEIRITHGLSKLPEYRVLVGMIRRCYNTKHERYKDYGGRGITVCDEWRHSFPAFYKAVGPRPTNKHTIERIDNSLGYFPGNVIWDTKAAQVRNRRNTKWFTINGRTQCLADWIRESGVSHGGVHNRLSMGWSIEEALNPITQSHMITHHGITQSLAEWSRQISIGAATIRYRLNAGWSIERALTQDVRPY